MCPPPRSALFLQHLLLPQVKDITLADFGRKEIELAEYEMPGLMACL